MNLSLPMAGPAEALQPDPAALHCDVLIVGGGINGTGIARDLAGRGWRVVLAERDDLASHTSSASTKLVHGGLRYLEHREFGLVRKALAERERLLRSAPHIMRPMRFVLPHDETMRPAWMIRLGLFLYDHLSRRELLPGSATVDLRTSALGAPLKAAFRRGFVYSDGWVDDARLVVLNAIDARDRGAAVLTRTTCVSAQCRTGHWHAVLRGACGRDQAVRARAIVNAAGPWADSFLRGAARSASGAALASRRLRLVKGSHIVVPRCFEHDHAYIFQSPDRRIVFAIPYQRMFTLIGTTDVEIEGPPRSVQADEQEIGYLCDQASRYFKRPVTAADVVWSYAGVRPLLDDDAGNPAAITRDYVIEASADVQAPLVSIWGGKITTYRKLAEQAADEVERLLGAARPPWTADASLPGGDLSAWAGPPVNPERDLQRFIDVLAAQHRWLPPSLLARYAQAYGSRALRIIADANRLIDLGEEVAPGLFAAELAYLRREEWAESAEDVLWRRSKLGLHLTPGQARRVAQWMEGDRHRMDPAAALA